MPPEANTSEAPLHDAAAVATVVDAVAQLLDVDEDTLALDAPLQAIDGWDSVNQLRILVFLERELGAPLDYDRFSTAETLGDLASLVADTDTETAAGART
ncbi:acyl carrier protein [Streptomyces sp. NBC_01255]|uniref:acyl carrier protein n=1 Tax=Streptomyces sp. NBC_01255 TaxID=2903798 RepID=UPI002E304D1B|nr:acyl carrier protein [Streptomyces sp. NBC_01255]